MSRYGQDQYGDSIPDLIGLPWPNTEEEYRVIMHTDWYQEFPYSPLLISWDAIQSLGLDEMDAIEDGLVKQGDRLMKIEPVLHRWNEEDGFYTA